MRTLFKTDLQIKFQNYRMTLTKVKQVYKL